MYEYFWYYFERFKWFDKIASAFFQARNFIFIKFCCSTRNIVRTYILSSMFLIILSECLCLLNGNLGLAKQKLIILSRIFRSLIFRVYSYFFLVFLSDFPQSYTFLSDFSPENTYLCPDHFSKNYTFSADFTINSLINYI